MWLDQVLMLIFFAPVTYSLGFIFCIYTLRTVYSIIAFVFDVIDYLCDFFKH